MNPITYLKGDATRPVQTGHELRVIAHIVNDKGYWGKGFTYALNTRWLAPQTRYRNWVATARYQQAQSLLGAVQFVQVEPRIYVANMCAQQGISYSGKRVVSYSALADCMRDIANRLYDHSYSLHMPRIGAGLGGGDWKTIEQIISEQLCSKAIPVYVYEL